MGGDWESEAAALSAQGPGQGRRAKTLPSLDPPVPPPRPRRSRAVVEGAGRGCKDSVEEGGGGGDGWSEG